LHLSFPHRFPLRLSVSSVVNQFLTTENTEEHREEIQLNAAFIAPSSLARPPETSALRCTRNARRPRSASTSRSPRACAAFTIPNVYFCPGTGTSTASSQVICRKTPVFGPPL